MPQDAPDLCLIDGAVSIVCNRNRFLFCFNWQPGPTSPKKQYVRSLSLELYVRDNSCGRDTCQSVIHTYSAWLIVVSNPDLVYHAEQ